jgi:hypothetical protein
MLISARSGVNGRDILGINNGSVGTGKNEIRKARSGSDLGSPSSRGLGVDGSMATSIRNEAIPMKNKRFDFQTAGNSRFEMITPLNLPSLPSGGSKTSTQSSNSKLVNGLPSPVKRGRGGSIDGGREIKTGKMSLFTGRKGKKESIFPASTTHDSEFLPIIEDNKKGKGKKKSTIPVPQSHVQVRKDPEEFVEWMKKGKVEMVDVGKMKTLRMLLRHESTM